METFKDKNEMENDKNTSLRDILVEFMSYTTGHGFGRLVAATTVVWRIFWTLAVLGAFGMFVYEVMNLFKVYLSRPVQTSVTVTFEKQLRFPAVTICNLNLIKRSSMVLLPGELVEKFAFNISYYDTNYDFDDKKDVNATEKPSEAMNTTKKPSEVVNSTEKPREVVNSTEKPSKVVNSTEKPSKVVNSTEKPSKVVNVTEKPSEVVNVTEKPTVAPSTTQPKRRRREEQKEDSKNDESSDNKENDENSYNNDGNSDGKKDGESYDNKTNEENYDEDKKNEDKKDEDKKDEDKKDEDKKDDEWKDEDKKDDEWKDEEWKNEEYYDDWKKDESYEDISEDYPDEKDLDTETKLRMKIESYIGGEDPSTLVLLGHKDNDLIKSCTWKGVDCVTGNLSVFWRWSWNYRYGNCYTFNDGMDEHENPLRVLKSSKPGPSQGLVLQLDIEENEYIGELTEEAGVRVVLHEHGVMPFPYEEGFSVGPGMATSVGLTKTMIKRLDRFEDGSCFDEGVLLSEDNLYRKNQNVTRYSLQACLNSCLGKSQLARCKCAEASYPSVQPCDVFDRKLRKCLQIVKYLFNKDQLPCIDKCKRPCREEVYEKTISTSQWPSRAHSQYLESMHTSSPNRSSVLLLNIFYSQLNFQVIEETLSYGTTNLLADIGGQLGLWIGISALTCGEVLELIFQLFTFVYMKFKNRRQNRVIQIGQATE